MVRRGSREDSLDSTRLSLETEDSLLVEESEGSPLKEDSSQGEDSLLKASEELPAISEETSSLEASEELSWLLEEEKGTPEEPDSEEGSEKKPSLEEISLQEESLSEEPSLWEEGFVDAELKESSETKGFAHDKVNAHRGKSKVKAGFFMD